MLSNENSSSIIDWANQGKKKLHNLFQITERRAESELQMHVDPRSMRLHSLSG